MARFLRTDLGLAHSRLEPPSVVGAGIAFSGPGTRLADPADPFDFARRGRATWNLAPPVVVNAPPIFFGPNVDLAPRTRVSDVVLRRAPFAKLFPPAAVTPAATPFVAAPLAVTLAVQETLAALPARKPRPKLLPPAVVGAGIVFAPIQVYLDVKSALNVESPERRARPRLSPPAVVAATAVFSGPTVHLVRALRPRALSRLGAPVVIAPLAPPVTTRLASSRRPKPTSVLRPPAVVGAGRVFRPVDVELAPSSRGRPRSRLAPPSVVGAGIVFSPVAVTLAPSTRGKPTSRLFAPVIPPVARPVETEIAVQLVRVEAVQRQPHSRLEPPAVVGAGLYFYPVSVTLAPSSRGKPSSVLRPPVIPPVAHPVEEKLAITLTRAELPGKLPHSRLFPPAVVGAGVYFYPVRVTLAPSRRGKPSSRLFQPVIPPLARPVEERLAVQLVRVSLAERQPHSRLSPPAVVGAGVVFRKLAVTLAPSRRGTPKSVLRPPVIPPVARPVETEIAVRLVRVEVVQRQPRSRLEPPAVVGAGIYFYPVRVALAPSKRGRPTSYLFDPAVVGDGVVFAPVTVTLAPSRRAAPRSVLRPPILPPLAAPVETKIAVELAESALAHRKTTSRLAPPAVVGAGRAFRKITVALAPSTDTPRRRRARARLSPPAVVQAAAVVFVGPVVHLAPSRRGAPKSRLRPPAVVGAGRVFRPVKVTLAASRRGEPTSALRAPTVVAHTFAPVAVTLAPSPRPVAKSALRPPVIPPLAPPLTVKLARTRRVERLSARLAPPTVVAGAVLYPIRVTFAASRRGRAAFLLRPPTVVRSATAARISVTLARIRPSATLSALASPTVVFTATELTLRLTLARIRPVETHPRLNPPTVVFTATELKIKVTLARIRPAATHPLLTPPTVVFAASELKLRVTLAAPSARRQARSRLAPPTVVRVAPFAPIRVTLARIRPARTEARLAPPAVVNPHLPPVVTTIAVHLAVLARNETQPALRTHWRLGGPNAVIVPLPGFSSGYSVASGGAESRDVPASGGSAETRKTDGAESKSVAAGGSTIRDVPASRSASRDRRRPLR